MTRSDGFTLIEVLVAFLIMSMTALAGLQLFSSGLARIGRIDETRRNLEIARALIASHEDPATLPDKWRVKVGPAIYTAPPWTTMEPHLVQVIRTVDGVDAIVLETIELRPRP
jgi:prepilin-type N-terminal cleavage/methylation domain-containing protein